MPNRADERADVRSGSNTGSTSGRGRGLTQFFKRKPSAPKEREKDSEWASLLKLWVVLVWLVFIAFFLSQTEWDWLASSWFTGIVLPIICSYIGVTALSYIV